MGEIKSWPVFLEKSFTPETLRRAAVTGHAIGADSFSIPLSAVPMFADAIELADNLSSDVVKLHFYRVKKDKKSWSDTGSCVQKEPLQCVRYLEHRGLLERHPEKPELVRLRP